MRITHPKTVCFLLMNCLLLSACASTLVIKTAYNRLDDRIASNFRDYADFSDEQLREIEAMAKSFHRWHRNTQLPRYATLLQGIAGTLASRQAISTTDAESWANEFRYLSMQVRQCHPLNRSIDLMAGLNDRQVKQAISHLRERQDEFKTRYESETIEQRLQRRFDSTLKWSARAGFDFNDEQRQLLVQTLARQHSLGKQRLALRAQWLDELENILGNRSGPDFNDQASAHIGRLWDLTERHHPRLWRENEELWTDFSQQFFELSSTDQRKIMIDQLNKYARIIRSLVPATPLTASTTCS